ncbi:MAG: hypothetical protein JWQ14_211, partial [Adhaeribacter sp.]|nr:hypothetical protein [Adhaeribacter sp.]
MTTTNYYNVFIQVAEDCPVEKAAIPAPRGTDKTAAVLQFELIRNNPYKYTSDDVLFRVYAEKNNLNGDSLEKALAAFFSKGQACFRASPLAKRYGWGVHSDAEGKIAIYPLESEEYARLSQDKNLKLIKAMRSKRV